MKNINSVRNSIILITCILCSLQVFISSCNKGNSTNKVVTKVVDDSSKTVAASPIQGLWIGTYSDASNHKLFESFSIFPDGTLSCKYLGSGNNWYFARGTWTLTGNVFSYSVVITNDASGARNTMSGTATFNSTNETLSNGTNVYGSTGTHSSFTVAFVHGKYL